MIVDAIKDCRQVLQMDSNNLIASEYLTRRNISLTLPYSSSSSSKFPGNGLSATIDKIRLSMKDHPLVELQSALAGDQVVDHQDEDSDRFQCSAQPSDDSSFNGIEERKAKKKRKKKKRKKSKSSKHESKKKKRKSEKSSTTDLAEDSG